jgi:hypothetical protein
MSGWKRLGFALFGLVLVIGGWWYVRGRLAVPPYQPLTPSDPKTEPRLDTREPSRITFTEPNMSSADRGAFLAGDFKVIRKVADLPEGIVDDFTASGSAQIAMADPGQRFQQTDVVVDETLPRCRLIFAGVLEGRAFVHYERGGLGESFAVDLFRLPSTEPATGIWRGYCNAPAGNLIDLRRRISESRCRE